MNICIAARQTDISVASFSAKLCGVNWVNRSGYNQTSGRPVSSQLCLIMHFWRVALIVSPARYCRGHTAPKCHLCDTTEHLQKFITKITSQRQVEVEEFSCKVEIHATATTFAAWCHSEMLVLCPCWLCCCKFIVVVVVVVFIFATKGMHCRWLPWGSCCLMLLFFSSSDLRRCRCIIVGVLCRWHDGICHCICKH